MTTARKLAAEVLTRCERSGQYSNLALDAALKREKMNDADRALTTVLVYGVLEKKITIDDRLRSLSARPLEQIDPEIRNHLRIGLYQLAFLDRIPDHAAVNEAVSLAGRRAGGFVNAILREFIRQGSSMPLPDKSTDAVRYLSIRYSVGEPLCRRLIADYGEERCASMLAAMAKLPPLTLRVNTLKTTREALLEQLQAAGYEAEPTPAAKSGIRVHGNAVPTAMPGFSEGLFFVQDEASQLCVEAVDTRPGMRVLDSCACPGSKSFGMAMEMQNNGDLIACDLHASKLSLVKTGGERMGISILDILERDARKPAPEWEHDRFDRILCDVPCSGFGVISKKPELREKDPAESEALPDIQLQILQTSAELLRVGGRLVYSTCTVLKSENHDNVLRFLAAHPEFSLLREQPLFPDTDHTDGFYIAVLQKEHERQKG